MLSTSMSIFCLFTRYSVGPYNEQNTAKRSEQTFETPDLLLRGKQGAVRDLLTTIKTTVYQAGTKVIAVFAM